MTVGTGVNADSEEMGFKLLAKKLYSTINKIYPHKVIFFASKKSKHTIEYVEDLFRQDDDEFIIDEDYQIVPIEAIDDFNACFESVEAKVWDFDYLNKDNNYQIIMDYTSGTKTMSAAMACCGLFYSKNLISVVGDRSTGEVSVGTEQINYQNLYKIYDKFALMRTRYNFNAHRFMACMDVLNYVVDLKINKESFLNLCKAYHAWDNMNFENAFDYLKDVDMNKIEFDDIRNELKYNLKALGTIVNARSSNLKNCYILASLINNAIRKAEEYKYDDAIARLYRAFELTAQIKLDYYNIDSSDVDTSILLDKNVSAEFIDGLENAREDEKIRIGLVMDYLLLNELGDDLGKYYVENENRIKNMTVKRNNSILAHGLESSSKEDFDEFLEVVINIARKLDKDMNKFLKETKFAKFDLKLKINHV